MAASYKFNREKMVQAARAGVEAGLRDLAITLQREIGTQLNQGASNRTGKGGPSAAGQPPHKATGHLARSWQVDDARDETKLKDRRTPTINVGTNVVYSRIHEYGGSIRGKPWLTIPVSQKAISGSAMGLSARQAVPDAYIIPSKKANTLLLVTGKTGQVTVHYVLKKSIIMPARPYVRPASNIVAKQAFKIVNFHVRRSMGRFA